MVELVHMVSFIYRQSQGEREGEGQCNMTEKYTMDVGKLKCKVVIQLRKVMKHITYWLR